MSMGKAGSKKAAKPKQTAKKKTAAKRAVENQTLVVVESPAKAKTIEKYLGKNYVVRASMGHLRDLPKSQFGIDVEHDFAPKYINIRGKGDLIKDLKKAAKNAAHIYISFAISVPVAYLYHIFVLLLRYCHALWHIQQPSGEISLTIQALMTGIPISLV